MLRMRFFSTLALFLISAVSHGSVTLGGTRIIYDAGKKEANINVINKPVNVDSGLHNVKNSPGAPFLIESWVENSDKQKMEVTPFIVTPPLFTLESTKENVLRIIYNGKSLPSDRESLFWLNVKSIPLSSSANNNTLQFAINNRIKLLYRPVGLPDDMSNIVQKIKWQIADKKLKVTNDTAYYITLYEVKIKGKKIALDNKQDGILAPKSRKEYPINTAIIAGDPVQWTYINDYGGTSQPLEQKIQK